ncbi:hypothetical protein SAMN05216167_12276 [Spirosoma endophyticum]|uniref:Uncharacterized protein n=1 Tax=Spirosoma endophyticum TaxID=662367 RepID=A0A1I2EN44_9BACT|nr:hypothetical protein SAMN05216167_12276 [Spirosoma endophyticum]
MKHLFFLFQPAKGSQLIVLMHRIHLFPWVLTLLLSILTHLSWGQCPKVRITLP